MSDYAVAALIGSSVPAGAYIITLVVSMLVLNRRRTGE